MNSWQRFTLSYVPFPEFKGASYLHRTFVGLLRSWRQSSWLMQWAEELSAVLVSLVFALAPFVSNTLVGVLLLACAGFWLLLTLSDETKTGLTPIHLLLLVYWGITTVATALSPVRMEAFSGWLKLTLYLMLFALTARIMRSPRIRSWLITLYLHIALIVSAYGIRQKLFGVKALATWNDPTSTLAEETRVFSYLGNPNLLADYLLPAIILSLMAIFVWRHKIPKALAVTMFVINTACLYYTGSRGGWIGLVVALGALVFLLRYWWAEYLPRFWRTWLLPIVVASSMSLLVLGMLFVEPLRLRVLSIFAGREDSSNNFRINVWLAVIDMIRDRPILGIGPGNTAFNKIYPLYQQPKYTALSAYSIFLEVAVETGLIGLTVFLWILIVTFNQGWLQLQRLRTIGNREGFWLIGAIASLLGLLAHNTVDTVWYRPEINTLWWLMVALIASYYRPSAPESEQVRAYAVNQGSSTK